MAFRALFKKITTTFRTSPFLAIYLKKSVYFRYEPLPPCSCICSTLYSGCSNIFTTAIYIASRKTPNIKRGPTKSQIISSLNFKSTEDAEPFYALPISTLYQIQRHTLSDIRKGYCENRLYYISSRIQCPPALLSTKIVKRTFVYSLSFEWIKNSLTELLDKGVPGDRILRDLWVLKYHHKTIRERLQRIKDKGIVSLHPWMVRCTPDILNRYLKLTQETRSILGDSNSTQTYIANRLNISTAEVEELCIKLPALKTIRAIKVKHFLDFLLNEGFTIEQIAAKPRILASSQKTIKKRLEQLRQLGEKDINLNLLCRSKKDFKRICDALEAKDCT